MDSLPFWLVSNWHSMLVWTLPSWSAGYNWCFLPLGAFSAWSILGTNICFPWSSFPIFLWLHFPCMNTCIWYMSPLAGHTVIALFPIAPIYCGCQIRYLYGCSRGLTCSRGSVLHKGACHKISILSSRRATIKLSVLSLSLPLPLAIIYPLTLKFNIVPAEAFHQETSSGLSVQCGVHAHGIL